MAKLGSSLKLLRLSTNMVLNKSRITITDGFDRKISVDCKTCDQE